MSVTVLLVPLHFSLTFFFYTESIVLPQYLLSLIERIHNLSALKMLSKDTLKFNCPSWSMLIFCSEMLKYFYAAEFCHLSHFGLACLFLASFIWFKNMLIDDLHREGTGRIMVNRKYLSTSLLFSLPVWKNFKQVSKQIFSMNWGKLLKKKIEVIQVKRPW